MVSLIHDSPRSRGILNHLTDHQHEIISSDRNHCKYVSNGINIHYEVLPHSGYEIMNCHPGVLKSYVNKLYEYKDSYFFSVDDDFTCLLAHSILKNTTVHFIHSPAWLISRINRLPIFQAMLRNRLVFTVSNFSQQELDRRLSLHSLVWPPFIDSNRFRFSRTKKHSLKIGYYSSGPLKGDNIITALATKMPKQRFIIIGRGYSGDVQCANITYLGDTTDLESFYGEISLLLVPSIIPEGFSRVIVEASMNAIPVIANRIGGIPEALGASGILIDIEPSEENMVSKYMSAITKLFNDPDAYEKYSRKAMERAQAYEKEIYRTSISYSDVFLSKINRIPDNRHRTQSRSRHLAGSRQAVHGADCLIAPTNSLCKITKIILSPHYDDAVLSLGGLLNQDNNVIVVTFFTGRPDSTMQTKWDRACGFENSDQAMAARKEENQQALSLLGIRQPNIIDLPFIDAQYRKNNDGLSTIPAKISSLITEYAHNELSIYCPIAIRSHVDHAFIHHALISVLKNIKHPRVKYFLYEELPHISDFKNKYPQSDIQLIVENRDGIKLEKHVVELAEDQHTKKRNAISLYKSQIGPLGVDRFERTEEIIYEIVNSEIPWHSAL